MPVCTQEEGVDLREGVGIKEVQQGYLLLEDGTEQAFDECLWCTQASAPPWLAHTGLQTGTPSPFPLSLPHRSSPFNDCHWCSELV